MGGGGMGRGGEFSVVAGGAAGTASFFLYSAIGWERIQRLKTV